MKKTMKRVLPVVALVLVVALASIGGTIAWLTDKTDEVRNTFTVGDINIKLDEAKVGADGKKLTGDDADRVTANSYKLVPGNTYDKDPTVIVEANSEDCYLFVKFEETNDPSTYLTYTSTLTTANGWTQGDGTDIPANVWYRKVMTSDTTRSWELLSGNTISVKDTVTKENMETAAKAELTYTAYASQLYKSAGVEFSAKEAWNNVKPVSGT